MNYTSFDRPAQEVSDETIITEFEFSSQVYADSNFTELYTPGNRVTGNVKKFALKQETIQDRPSSLKKLIIFNSILNVFKSWR